MAERSNGQPSGGPPTSQAPAADLAELVRAHHAAVYRYAYRLCGNATEAEDLTQQTFLIAVRKVHQVREAEKACSWLLAVVRSCFLKSLRKSRPAPAGSLELEAVDDATAPEIDEVDRERLAAALSELPPEFRIVVLMFYFEELSYQEIASELEIPIGTVMSRLSRAKGQLRTRLSVQHKVRDTPRVPSSGPAASNGNGVGRTSPARLNP